MHSSRADWHYNSPRFYQPATCSYFDGLQTLSASIERAEKLLYLGNDWVIDANNYMDSLESDLSRHKKALNGDPQGLLMGPILMWEYNRFEGIPRVKNLCISYARKISGEKTNFKALLSLFNTDGWGPLTRSRSENIVDIKDMLSKLRKFQDLQADETMVRSYFLLKSLRKAQNLLYSKRS
jgi:hypothetical protein